MAKNKNKGGRAEQLPWGLEGEFFDKKSLPFQIEDLQKILSETSAPTVVQSVNGQTIAEVCNHLFLRFDPPPDKSAKYAAAIKRFEEGRKWRAKIEAAWELLEEDLPKMIKQKEDELAELKVANPHVHSGEFAYNEFEITNLRRALDGLIDARFCLSWDARRKQGHRGGLALTTPMVAAEIFVRLPHAWEEAEQSPPKENKELRYRIIQAIYARAGKNIETETIRKAIDKTLSNYPEWHKKRETKRERKKERFSFPYQRRVCPPYPAAHGHNRPNGKDEHAAASVYNRRHHPSHWLATDDHL